MRKKLLFVLDLNGTILHRLTKPAMKRGYAEHPNFRGYDCSVDGNPIVFRPHHVDFIKRLFMIGEVAVWTSAMPKNAIPMVMHSFSTAISRNSLSNLPLPIPTFVERHQNIEMSSSNQNKLLFLKTQIDCDVFPKEKGDFKPKFIKDLQVIFDDPLLNSDYNRSNTIIVDDSIAKFSSLDQKNLLVIPEFIVSDPNFNFEEDRILLQTIEFFESFYKNSTTQAASKESIDVRQELENNKVSCLFKNLEI